QHAPPAIALDRGDVVVAGGAKMRREQYVEAEFAVAVEPAFDDQHVAPRVGGDAQLEGVAGVPMGDLYRRDARRQQAQRIILVALDLRPEPVGAGDDKAQVADLRGVDPRIIDLVDDAEPQGEPQPGRPQRGADHVLGTARPGWRDPGSAGGVFE